jgi:hypothetical protein
MTFFSLKIWRLLHLFSLKALVQFPLGGWGGAGGGWANPNFSYKGLQQILERCTTTLPAYQVGLK